jgi:hypothetical protein
MTKKRVDFPSAREDPNWPGEWRYGDDSSGESKRVIAVHFGHGDDVNWVGPIELTNDNVAKVLESWAERMIDLDGGNVHLFSADGDATKEFLDEEKELEKIFED